MSNPHEILDLILSTSREAGTEGAHQARRTLREHLSALGYAVEEEPFRFSASSLTAYPLFGAGLGWLMLIQIPLLTVPRAPAWAALATWLIGGLALGVLVAGVSRGWAPMRGQTRETANIVATRGSTPVNRWVVAHYDTKAQGLSLAGRLLAMVYASAVLLGLTLLAVLRLRGAIDVDIVAGAAALTLLACGLAGRGAIRGESTGARDNGTGLLAALTVAQHSTDPGTGILLTSAQQFGLLGARIFAQEHGPSLPGVEVVNLDTIDDQGPLKVWYHDEVGAGFASQVARRLGQDGAPVVKRKVSRAAAVDSVPLARSGASAVTVSRFDWATLRRIHTARDTPDDMQFKTAEAVGRALAGPI